MENKVGDKFKSKHPKLAEFIENKAPKILNVVGGVLPDKGVLGIVKNLITTDPEISEADKLEFEKLYLEAEKEETKRIELELNDKANARAREIALNTSDSASWLSKNISSLIAIIVVIAVLLMYAAKVFGWSLVTVSDQTLRDLRDIVLLIIGYYFGSSVGSKMKQNQIDKLAGH